jgi:hypothetical protein
MSRQQHLGHTGTVIAHVAVPMSHAFTPDVACILLPKAGQQIG